MSLIDSRTWCPAAKCPGEFIRKREPIYVGDPWASTSQHFWIDVCDKCGYTKHTLKSTGNVVYVPPSKC